MPFGPVLQPSFSGECLGMLMMLMSIKAGKLKFSFLIKSVRYKNGAWNIIPGLDVKDFYEDWRLNGLIKFVVLMMKNDDVNLKRFNLEQRNSTKNCFQNLLIHEHKFCG